MDDQPEVPSSDRTFVDIPAEEWVASNDRAFAIRDRFPVATGHTLVIPKRIVTNWWDADDDERSALFALVDQVKSGLDLDFSPSGYNVGFNDGLAAGQTVMHLHVHVIPRYDGDVADPTGGVRHVIPGMGNYLRPGAQEQLRDAPARPLLPALIDAVARPETTEAAFAASFVMMSGVHALNPVFDELLDRPDSAVRLLTTDYLGVTERTALQSLLDRHREFSERFQVKLFRSAGTSFHPKAYILTSTGIQRVGHVFVGSANASRYGLVDGHEWTLGSQAPETIELALQRFDELWNDERSVPLTQDLVDNYKEAERPISHSGLEAPAAPDVIGIAEPPTQPVKPTEIQFEALDELARSRARGYRAGLVVMATGLGKTWLAAFDSARPEFRRTLFIAHREEILTQARTVFRKVHPQASVGMLGAGHDDRHADIVMATIQTLAQRINEFDTNAFDYVIIDEFHHAAAPTYRRVINHLDPAFQLGITATPMRTDRADLLALCEDNLVFECGLADGIERSSLSPFHYIGVLDPIDFRTLPWRSSQFDPTELENAVITAVRTEAAWREWSANRGGRTLAFCVSQRHANWMAQDFTKRGVRAVAVHTGQSSSPRAESLQRLRAGELDIVFSVDLFNEGTDIPEIDTVLMLRPTQSPVLFMQQIGRGLRLSPGKDALTIVDFVGNHRSFLLPLRTIASLTQANISDTELAKHARSGHFQLPAGCSVDYSLGAIDTLLDLLPKSVSSPVSDFVRSWTEERGTRPTSLETYLAGLNPSTLQPSWFGELDAQGLLTSDEQRVWQRHQDLLNDVAKTRMQKSYKIVALKSMLGLGNLRSGADVSEISEDSRRLIMRDPRLRRDIDAKEVANLDEVSPGRWASYWRKFPLTHLQTGGNFTIKDDRLALESPPDTEDVETLSDMIAELCDWRLSAYLDKLPSDRILLKVSHSSHQPILRLDRDKHESIPAGRGIPILVGDQPMTADFMKVAINVIRSEIDGPNQISNVARDWFGPMAGEPGTDFYVELWMDGTTWRLSPDYRRQQQQMVKAN